MMMSGWIAERRLVYQLSYNPEEDFEEVAEIVKKIQNKDFRHKDFPNKCKFCQYNQVCPDRV